MAEDKYLEKRREELEDIKKVSSQVLEITQNIKAEVAIQGENLNMVENNINQVVDNTKKSEFEISTAEKETRSQTKKNKILVILVQYVLVSIIQLLYFVFLNPGTEQIAKLL